MAGITTQGIALFWSTSTAASTASSVLVGEVTNISGPSGSKAEIDVTSLQSAGKEYLMALPDFGDVSFDLNWTGDVTQTTLYADWVSATSPKRKAVIKIAESTAVTRFLIFDGYVKQFSWSMGKDDAVKASCAIRISGAATLSTTMS